MELALSVVGFSVFLVPDTFANLPRLRDRKAERSTIDVDALNILECSLSV